MDKHITSNISFSSDKVDTIKSTECKKTNHPCISDFESFEAFQIAFENATTIDEQQKFSHIIPLIYDTTNHCYKLQPNSEKIFNYLVENNKKPKTSITFDITKSKLYQKRFGNSTVLLTPLIFTDVNQIDPMMIPPHLNPEKYTSSPFI